jgi:hypothetical protein
VKLGSQPDDYDEDGPSRLILWIVGSWIVLIALAALLYVTLA